MSISLNGSTQWAARAAGILTNEPILMLVWANPSDLIVRDFAMSLGNNGASGFWGLEVQGAVAGDPVRATKDNDAGSGAVSASSSAGPTAGAWNLLSAMFTADNARAARLGGANEGTDATSRTDPTPDWTAVGALQRSSGILSWGGLLAEAVFAAFIPTEIEYMRLARKIRPRYIRPQSHTAYYPLLADALDDSGNGNDLTEIDSPTYSTHPPMRGDAGFFMG